MSPSPPRRLRAFIEDYWRLHSAASPFMVGRGRWASPYFLTISRRSRDRLPVLMVVPRFKRRGTLPVPRVTSATPAVHGPGRLIRAVADLLREVAGNLPGNEIFASATASMRRVLFGSCAGRAGSLTGDGPRHHLSETTAQTAHRTSRLVPP